MSSGNKCIPGKKNTRRELSVPVWNKSFDKSVRDRNLAVEHRGERNTVQKAKSQNLKKKKLHREYFGKLVDS